MKKKSEPRGPSVVSLTHTGKNRLYNPMPDRPRRKRKRKIEELGVVVAKK